MSLGGAETERLVANKSGIVPTARLAPGRAVFAIPLPGRTLINVSTEAVHHRPFFVGETLSCYDEGVEISPERTTRLGTGHFITTVFHCAGALDGLKYLLSV